MSALDEIKRIIDAKSAIKASIEAKGVVVPEGTKLDGMSTLIDGIRVGGGFVGSACADWNDVTFIDFDGTILYAYSLAEVHSMTELPELPEHDGLVCQGWNWSLDEIKSTGLPVTVGAKYLTDDGATRLHIQMADSARKNVPIYFGQTVSGGVSIDWGDGSAAQTLSGTGYVNTYHTYEKPGEYTISLLPIDGCVLSIGGGSSSYSVMSGGSSDAVYRSMLKSVNIGKQVESISAYSFKDCYILSTITIPNGVTSVSTYAFSGCTALTSIVTPDGLTDIFANAFYGCYALSSVALPSSITGISRNAFQNCYALKSIIVQASSIARNVFANCYSLSSVVFQNGLVDIGLYSFQNCSGVRYYDFSRCTSVPFLYGTVAFDGIPSDCQILIPASLYDEWCAATNWSTYASNMVAV